MAACLLLGFLSGASAASTTPQVWNFVSDPAIRPARVRVLTERSGTAPGYLFMAPLAETFRPGLFYGQTGPLILDSAGRPVWALPLAANESALDFRRQTYRGQPVLTWWQGRISLITGWGTDAHGVIMDSHYRSVATIRSSPGTEIDAHDLLLTSHGTALFPADRLVAADLSAENGPRHGTLMDEVIEEEDIATHRIVWTWDPRRHVSLSESYVRPDKAGSWDPFHVNSIDVDKSGNLLISMRNTWTVYYVDRVTGRILWRLGGKRSSFRMGRGAGFAWQHDADFLPGGRISLFDDEASPAEADESRAIILWLDRGLHTANLKRTYAHPGRPLLAGGQGSSQLLSNGDDLVGWGDLPYMSEFSRTGSLLLNFELPGDDESYRVYRFPWKGQPTSPPKLALQTDGGQLRAYASWNGATEVAKWELMAGLNTSALHGVESIARTGFETTLPVPAAAGGVFEVRALDGSGHTLGTSAPAQP